MRKIKHRQAGIEPVLRTPKVLVLRGC